MFPNGCLAFNYNTSGGFGAFNLVEMDYLIERIFIHMTLETIYCNGCPSKKQHLKKAGVGIYSPKAPSTEAASSCLPKLLREMLRKASSRF